MLRNFCYQINLYVVYLFYFFEMVYCELPKKALRYNPIFLNLSWSIGNIFIGSDANFSAVYLKTLYALCSRRLITNEDCGNN